MAYRIVFAKAAATHLRFLTRPQQSTVLDAIAMKTLEMSQASKPLAEYARHLGKEPIIVIHRKKPVAALVSLRDIDREALSLSTNPEFLRIIEASRAEVRAGKTVSLASIKQQLTRTGST